MVEGNIAVIGSQDAASLRNIIDTIPSATLIIDSNGIFIDCNRATLQIFDASRRTDIVGKPPAILSPPKQRNGRDSDAECVRLLQKAHESGSVTFYYDHLTLKGKIFPARVSLSEIEYEGNPCLMCTITDMTGQVRVEENETLIKQNPYAMITLNPDITIADVNPAFSHISGYKKEESIGKGLGEFKIIRRDGPTVQDAIQTKQAVTGKIIVDFPNGIKNMQYSYIPVFDANDELILIYDIFADLTELVQKVNESNSLISENPASIVTMDTTGKILAANPAFQDLSRLSKDKLLTMNLGEFKILERDGESLKDIVMSKRPSKGRLVVDFGWAVKTLDFTYIPILDANGVVTSMVGMYLDVSDQVAYVDEIAKFVHENPHAIVTMTPDSKITDVNPAFSRILGYSYEESTRMKLSDLKVLERNGGTIRDSLQSKNPVSGTVIADTPAGIRHLAYVYVPILDKKGEVVKFLEIFSDLTEQKNLIAYYESILDAVPLPIHVTDIDMKWTYMNKPFEKILMNNRVIQDRGSAYGMPCYTANANICKTNECGIHKLRTTGKNETFFEWMGASNKQTTAPVVNASGETVGYVETVQDLTEQIRLIEFLQKEVARLSENIVKLSNGNFDLNLQMTASDQYSEKAEVMFEEINTSISTLITALHNLIQDSDGLAHDATNGNLKSRANIERHKGEFRKIVEGFNRTLESVIQPINESLRVCENYASYDFTVRFSSSLEVKGDWIQFKNALNHIGESVCDAIQMISRNVNDLATSAEEAHVSVEEVVTGAQQIATSAGKVSQNAEQGEDGISQVLKAMEDLNVTVSAVSQKAESVSIASDQANNLAKEGISIAHQSERAMEDITTSAKEVDTIVTGINTQMDEIGKIVRLISDIANQTNLLALNAAIEAARAGEAGRGFAVVAAEVKSLAQDSRKSAENIEDMIAALQTKAQQATEAMGKSTRAVQDGSSALEQTLAAFNKIAGTIEDINRNTVEVASASEEQAASVEEVTASIQEVSNLVQNTSHEAGDAAAATQEASASIDEVGRIMNGVVGIVENISHEIVKFKVA